MAETWIAKINCVYEMIEYNDIDTARSQENI